MYIWFMYLVLSYHSQNIIIDIYYTDIIIWYIYTDTHRRQKLTLLEDVVSYSHKLYDKSAVGDGCHGYSLHAMS